MLNIKKEGILLEKTALNFENEGVLNPASIKINDDVHLFYRAVSKDNFSCIGYCRLSGPLTIAERFNYPVLFPEFDYESHGVEDPRIVNIDGVFYLSYTAYDGTNALGALATSTDLVHFKKHGIIVPQLTYSEFVDLKNNNEINSKKQYQFDGNKIILEDSASGSLIWDKNLIFFPRRVNNKLYFLHRIKPNIQIVVGVADLADLTPEFWRNYIGKLDKHTVLSPKYKHEISYVGGGCPPIETEFGWLLIYHGVEATAVGFVYSACAALLDLETPELEIARLPEPLFKPDQSWEITGEVNNVCFPTGAAVFDDRLYIYYGAADEHIATASTSLSVLLKELLNHKTPLDIT